MFECNVANSSGSLSTSLFLSVYIAHKDSFEDIYNGNFGDSNGWSMSSAQLHVRMHVMNWWWIKKCSMTNATKICVCVCLYGWWQWANPMLSYLNIIEVCDSINTDKTCMCAYTKTAIYSFCCVNWTNKLWTSIQAGASIRSLVQNLSNLPFFLCANILQRS